MFTGIVEALGKVLSTEKESNNLRICVAAPFLQELKVDQSISHNGVCLTIEKLSPEDYEVVAIDETLRRSNLAKLNPGDSVNLERCLKIGDRLDGHMVQGHVDETAICTAIDNMKGSWLFTFSISKAAAGLIVQKGSVCVNGVSLTVVEAGNDFFSVAIIPFTYENTNFRFLHKGDTVNIEYDVIGKYVQRMLEKRL